MAEKTGLPDVPGNIDPAVARFLRQLRSMVVNTAQTVLDQNTTLLTLEQLLKGTAPVPAAGRGLKLPPVTNYNVRKLPNSIEFVLTPFKLKFAWPPILDFEPNFPNLRVQLWRSLDNENALNAEFLKETTALGLYDHPPPGVKYRYWMRYVTDIVEQAGPFTPTEGIPYTADEVVNPEGEFDSTSGGIFLETFEGLDVVDNWTEMEPSVNNPTLTYPAVGVVGGVVAQFAGDEAWRVHNALIPYDPQTLYRIRVGVRYTVAPTNPAKNVFWAGVQCVSADGVTLLNRLGGNTYDNQHYVAAAGADLTTGGINNWQTFIGYFSGLGTPTLPAPNIYAPSPLYPGTKYFQPLFILNYDDGDGTAQIDYVRVEALNPLDISLTSALSPSSVTLPANQLKQVLSYALATGTMEVRYGSYLLNGSAAVSFSIVANPQSLAANINSAGVFSITGGLDSSEDTATITFRATFNSVTVDRTLTLTKSIEGGFGWTPIVDIDSGGGDIRIVGATFEKVGGIPSWDSGVYSLEAYTQGIVVTWRAANTTGHFMIGLNSDPATDANWTSIDFAFHCVSGGNLDIYESNALIGNFGTYTTADVLSVTYDGEKIRYLKNSTLLREVLAPGRALSFDSSFYAPGSKALDVNFNAAGPIANSNRFATTGNCKYGGSVIEKVGGSNAWDSSAYSLDGYGACFVSFTVQTAEMVIGLNTDPQLNSDYTGIDYAFNPATGGSLYIQESGSPLGPFGTWNTSTVLSITYDGEKVRYLKDNAVLREVIAPGRVLYLDSSFYHVGSKVSNVQFGASGIVGAGASTFIATNSCVVVGSSMEKVNGVSAWDSAVYSREGYTEGAFCSARCDWGGSFVMFGLNTDPTTDSNYNSIDYAWYFNGSGNQCMVFESGSNIATFGTFTASTVLAIRHIGALVQYIKDGVVVRSVTRTATTPLFFDSSFSDNGSRLVDVHFGPAGKGAEADPSAVFLETFESPWETSWANYANAGNVVVTYPNNGQFGGKVIRAQRQLYIHSNELIPFDSTALYRITTRIRRVAAGGGAGTENVYCGAWGVAADGVTWTTQEWGAASAFDMSAIALNTWVDFVGYFKGIGSNISGVAPNNDSPKNMASGTTFIRPTLLLNYSSGSGTQECDFVKIERLVNPNDADNTDKNRVIPDSEFALATDDTYWYRTQTGTGSASTTTPVISTTGGAVAGKVTLRTSGTFSPVRRAQMVSRRRIALQAGSGQLYTGTIRWRRSGSVDGGSFATFLGLGLIRHNQSPSNATFAMGSSIQTAGGIALTGPQLDARTVNEWQEDSGIIFLPKTSVANNAAFPYISALLSWVNSVDRTIEVDYAQIVAGVQCDPQIYEFTTTPNTAVIYARNQYNSASPGTLVLPTLVDDSYVGAKVYFEQTGTGLLTIAVDASNTLQSPPATTGSRSMTGRWAKAYAECINSTTWRLVGQLA